MFSKTMPENSGSTSLTISVTHIKSLRICEVFKKMALTTNYRKLREFHPAGSTLP